MQLLMRHANLESIPGRLIIQFAEVDTYYPWSVTSEPAENSKTHIKPKNFGFASYYFGQAGASAATPFVMIVLPLWFLVLPTGSLAMICQLRWPPRFTLRSLFIATTFLAIVLGMIAWLDRAWIGK